MVIGQKKNLYSKPTAVIASPVQGSGNLNPMAFNLRVRTQTANQPYVGMKYKMMHLLFVNQKEKKKKKEKVIKDV